MMRRAQIFASGQCGCLDYDLTQGDDWTNVYDRLTMADDLIGDETDDVKRQVVELICSSTMNDGDHLQVCAVVWCGIISSRSVWCSPERRSHFCFLERTGPA